MLQVYMDSTYSDGRPLTDHEITGMVIWFMFAGHHTSSNTTAWTLLEIARTHSIKSDCSRKSTPSSTATRPCR